MEAIEVLFPLTESGAIMYTMGEVAMWIVIGIILGFTGGFTLGLREGNRVGYVRGKIAGSKRARS